jgi:hypothetical protein
MTKKALEAAAGRLNPTLVLIVLGLGVIDLSLGLSRMAPPMPLRGVSATPPASQVMSADVTAAIADMKDRD